MNASVRNTIKHRFFWASIRVVIVISGHGLRPGRSIHSAAKWCWLYGLIFGNCITQKPGLTIGSITIVAYVKHVPTQTLRRGILSPIGHGNLDVRVF